MLQTKTVNADTLELLKKLQSIEELQNFRLVGGTALALQLGHRFSIDLDLFSYEIDVPEQFQTTIAKKGISVENISISKRIKIFRLNKIKVDFVNYSYPWTKNAIIEDGICMASLEDIAAMKLSAITNRGTRKDFVDLYFLLEMFDFKQLLSFYHEKYPEAADFLLFKSVLYFEDAESEPMPKMFDPIKWHTIKSRIKNITKDYIS